MKRHVVHLAIVVRCVGALAIGALAAGAGSPGSNARPDPGAAPTPSPGMPESNDDAAAVARPVPLGDLSGLSLSSFGPVPGCGDQVTISVIVRMLRQHVVGSALGLANIHVAGHSRVGGLVHWNCEAEVQPGGAGRDVRYQIDQTVVGRERWQITILGPAAAAAE